MRKMKYEDAVMEIVKFNFEDVLDTSDQDNIGDGSDLDNPDDEAGKGNPWG